jgi:hypothetical protein
MTPAGDKNVIYEYFIHDISDSIVTPVTGVREIQHIKQCLANWLIGVNIAQPFYDGMYHHPAVRDEPPEYKAGYQDR